MTVQVINKNMAKSSDSSVLVLFADEKFQLMVQGLLAHFVFGTGLFIGYSSVY